MPEPTAPEEQPADPSHLRLAIESAVSAGAPLASTATALHEMDVNGHANVPWIQEVPGIDHASSFVGSWAVAAGITVAVAKIADRLDVRGNEQAAERMRRASNVIAWSGSIACQLAVETNKWGGTGDVRDVIAGAIATVPGIIHGKTIMRQGKRARQRRESKLNAQVTD